MKYQLFPVNLGRLAAQLASSLPLLLVWLALWLSNPATAHPGTYNDWVQTHNLPTALSSPTNAPAGDGIANLLKFALGLDPLTPAGMVTTLGGVASVWSYDANGLPQNYRMTYGGVDGRGTHALLTYPTFVAVDNNTNLYVTDLGNQVVRKGHK